MSEKDRTPGETLSPAVDPVRWEAAVRSIRAAAAPELERRAKAASALSVLERWSRPVLSAAATVVLLASAAMFAGGRSGGEEVAGSGVDPDAAVASALLPGAMSTWIVEGETESVVALVQALEGR
jgi:hypothetical protein